MDTANTNVAPAADTAPAPQPPTLGEKRVRVAFNASNSTVVHEIKVRAAELIDLVDQKVPAPQENLNEFFRLKALAITAIEEAAMWAVKAATL